MNRVRSLSLVVAAALLAAIVSSTTASAQTADAGSVTPAGVWWGDWNS